MTTIIIAASKKDAERYQAAHPELAPVTIVTPGSKTTAHSGPVHATAAGRAHAQYPHMLQAAAPGAQIVRVDRTQANNEHETTNTTTPGEHSEPHSTTPPSPDAGGVGGVLDLT